MKKVLRDIAKTHHSLTVGKESDATRAYNIGTAFIKDGSKEQQLVADYHERGLSLIETTMLVDKWSIQNNRETVWRSVVHSCKQNMRREV